MSPVGIQRPSEAVKTEKQTHTLFFADDTALFLCVVCFKDQRAVLLLKLFFHSLSSFQFLLYPTSTSLLCLYNITEPARACVWEIKSTQGAGAVSHALRIQGQVGNAVTCSFENKKRPNNVGISRDRKQFWHRGSFGAVTCVTEQKGKHTERYNVVTVWLRRRHTEAQQDS